MFVLEYQERVAKDVRVKESRARGIKEPGAALGVLRKERLKRGHGPARVGIDLVRVQHGAPVKRPGEQIAEVALQRPTGGGGAFRPLGDLGAGGGAEL